MKLNAEEILEKANSLYAAAKLQKAGVPESEVRYMAPELLPQIESEQVKSVLIVLVDELNQILEKGGDS